MAKITAQLKHLRMAPRKVRLVADSIRMKRVRDAIQILSFLPKYAALPVLKLLHSARANAKNNFHIEDDNNLYVAEIRVDEGRVLKRYSPRAMGRATLVRKKSSHITLVLDEIRKKPKKEETKEVAKNEKAKRTKKSKEKELVAA